MINIFKWLIWLFWTKFVVCYTTKFLYNDLGKTMSLTIKRTLRWICRACHPKKQIENMARKSEKSSMLQNLIKCTNIIQIMQNYLLKFQRFPVLMNEWMKEWIYYSIIVNEGLHYMINGNNCYLRWQPCLKVSTTNFLKWTSKNSFDV